MTLKELKDQLNAFPHIFKTYRSYSMNLQETTAISENIQR